MLTTQEKTVTQKIKDIFTQQQAHFQRIGKMSAVESRIEKIEKMRDAMMRFEKRLQDAAYQDFKRNPTETTFAEVLPTNNSMKHAISHTKKWTKPKSVSMPLHFFGAPSFVQYEPKGCVLIIAPWNYPFLLAIEPLVWAIAAGNNVIIKPSELTPHVAAVIQDMIESIFSPNEVAVVQGGLEVSQELLKMPFDHIFFTGSTQVGKIVMEAAAKNLTSVTLELGGKSPTIIDETANIEDAAHKIAWGKFLNAGQTCIAPDYVLIHSSVKEKFITALKQQIDGFYNKDGKGIAQSPDFARIVNANHFKRVQNLIHDAVSKGANVVSGGHTDSSENYIEPTLLTDVNLDMEVMRQEIFAPVLPILTYERIDEVVELVNSKMANFQIGKPLALYIFSKDKKNRNYILQSISSGGAAINDCVVQISQPYLPFGGVNGSGIGKTHGFYGFEAFSNAKGVVKQRIGLTPFDLIYPPFDKAWIPMLIKFLKRFV